MFFIISFTYYKTRISFWNERWNFLKNKIKYILFNSNLIIKYYKIQKYIISIILFLKNYSNLEIKIFYNLLYNNQNIKYYLYSINLQ